MRYPKFPQAPDLWIAVILLILLCVGGYLVRDAEAKVFQINTPEGSVQFDLRNPDDRLRFREKFKNHPKLGFCVERADFALIVIKERDGGVSSEQFFASMHRAYDRKKKKGDVPPPPMWVDMHRTINDLYRKDPAGNYIFTDPNIIWEREFEFCVTIR